MNMSQNISNIDELMETLAAITSPQEMAQFMKDLCTPQEITALAERWRVCKLLHQGQYSYREIHDITGASLATITRVARFLNNEPHQGYRSVLDAISRNKKE